MSINSLHNKSKLDPKDMIRNVRSSISQYLTESWQELRTFTGRGNPHLQKNKRRPLSNVNSHTQGTLVDFGKIARHNLFGEGVVKAKTYTARRKNT